MWRLIIKQSVSQILCITLMRINWCMGRDSWDLIAGRFSPTAMRRMRPIFWCRWTWLCMTVFSIFPLTFVYNNRVYGNFGFQSCSIGHKFSDILISNVRSPPGLILLHYQLFAGHAHKQMPVIAPLYRVAKQMREQSLPAVAGGMNVVSTHRWSWYKVQEQCCSVDVLYGYGWKPML